jgi:4-amino-4-deoxy-L-arabinose transferase-like glycosyltransferase
MSVLGIAVIVAVGLALLTRQPATFLLIPLAAAFLWFSRRSW